MHTLLVVLPLKFRLDWYHPFTHVCTVHHDVVQQSCLYPQVKEANVMVDGIVVNAISNLIAEAIHESTFPNGIDLIKGSCDVKANGVHVVILHTIGHSFPGQPSSVGTTKFQLVAVLIRLFRPHDRSELG